MKEPGPALREELPALEADLGEINISERCQLFTQGCVEGEI